MAEPRPISSFLSQRPTSKFVPERPMSGFTEDVEFVTDEESIPATLVKSVARDIRFIPKAMAGALRIFGVDEPWEEIKRTEKFVTPRATGIQKKAGDILGTAAQTGTVFATSAALARGKINIDPLTIQSVGAGTIETARLLDEGEPLDRAIFDGVVTGLLARITEGPGYEQLKKLASGTKFLKSLIGKGGKKQVTKQAVKLIESNVKTFFKAIGYDVFGEVTENTVKSGLVDPLILDREFPSPKKLVDEATDTATTAAGASLIMALFSVGIGKVGDIDISKPRLTKPKVLKPTFSDLARIARATEVRGPESKAPNIKTIPQQEALEPITPQEMEVRSTARIVEEVRDIVPYEETNPLMSAQREIAKTEYAELNRQEVPKVARNDLDNVIRTSQEARSMPAPDEVITPSDEAFLNDPVTKDVVESTERVLAQQKITADKVRKLFNKNILDRQATVKGELDKLGKVDPEAIKAKENLVLRAGASALTDYEFAKIGKDISGSFSKLDYTYFNTLLQAKRGIEIARNKGPQFKFQKGRTKADFETNIKKIPPDRLANLMPKAKKYWAKMDNILQDLVDEGIQTQEEKDRISAKGEFYTPRQVLDYLDGPQRSYLQQGKKISIPDSGIQKLSEEGSLRMIESDAMFLMKQAIARKNARIFNNRANVPMYQFAIQNPNNGVIEEVKITGETKEGKPIFESPKAGFQDFSVMIEGQQKKFRLPNELASEWVTTDPVINKTVGSILHLLSGNFILKPMATGLNVGFAFAQTFKDSSHIWLTTEEYSPVAPVAMLQMGVDLVETFKDVIQRKGLWEEALENGMGLLTLTQEGRPRGKLTESLRTAYDTLGWLSTTTEMWTRLALYNRSLKNGKSPRQAAFIARNYIDFHQGGNFTKAIDNALAYTNASVQGTRGIGRAFKTNPKVALAKTAQLIALGGMFYWLWNSDDENKEFYRDVKQHDLDNNLIVPLPFRFKDAKGVRRKPYVKIPLDQGQRLFTSIGRNLWSRMTDGTWDDDDLTRNAVNAFPVLPTEAMSPTVEAVLGYAANKDFWRKRDIWNGPDVRADFEKTPYTPEIFVDIGKMTGTSPERLRYATRQIFTSGNVWTALGGYALKTMLDQFDDDGKDEVGKTLWEQLERSPISKRFIGTTNPHYRQQKEAKELQQAENTRKAELKEQYDSAKRQVRLGKANPQDFARFLFAQNPIDQQMLINRDKNITKLEELNVPNPSFWMGLSGLSPEVKANVIYNEWISSTEEVRKEIERAATELSNKKLFGLSSQRVVNKLNSLIIKHNKHLKETEQ